jgi:hypothetical protein
MKTPGAQNYWTRYDTAAKQMHLITPTMLHARLSHIVTGAKTLG